ncbi:DUF4194 domain-containing protein [Candidatus Entotheonella palauensis]|uniref:DUF4194 domain-containing protein n=1 Tax=Candidatus Entotheonella gemina TaxID=1429439 RepID=W4ME15_9BACT|nr:DUF4194 domain-containing protein [Candidatus Entotheonella palauensis]ETX08584.1 MAG: hypothetical protein ETSY2_04550 [Candidatus Entotheonella gemina]
MSEPLLPYAAAIIKLLRGVVYFDDKEWETLLSYEKAIELHMAGIGLRLHVDEADGYAYLSQPDDDEGESENETAVARELPRLVRRIPLNFEATLLCVVLREELLKFEMREPGLERMVLSKQQIQEAMQIFYPEPADMTRLMGRIDRVIGQVERAGFLRPIKHGDEDVYEVKRIIKAKISADKLVEIRDQLRQYADSRRAV